MSLGVAAGVVGTLLAIAAWIWYKVKTAGDAKLQSAAVDQLRAQAQASQDEALRTAKAAREALRAEAKKVLSVEDPEARKQAALALLHRVRGVR